MNLIQALSNQDQITKINTSIRLGDLEIRNEPFSLRVHQIENDITQILSINTGAKGNLNGNVVFGVLVDVDSIKSVKIQNFRAFADSLENDLVGLKQSNKE